MSGAKFSLTILHLYPDLLNLYGDNGNLTVLERRLKWRGIDVEVKTVNDGEPACFCDTDIVVIGGGSKHKQLQASRNAKAISDSLGEYVESGGVMLAVCAGFQLLGRSCEIDGDTVECFGILDFHTVEGKDRFIGNIAVEAELGGKNVVLAGFENHSGRTMIESYRPLGKVIFGHGNDGESGYEGLVYKNTVATHMHGPLLPKNPELADFLIKAALKRKYPNDFGQDLSSLDDTLEVAAKKFIIDRELKEANR